MAGIAILFSWALAWLLLKGALLHGTWHMARQGWGGWFQSNVIVFAGDPQHKQQCSTLHAYPTLLVTRGRTRKNACFTSSGDAMRWACAVVRASSDSLVSQSPSPRSPQPPSPPTQHTGSQGRQNGALGQLGTHLGRAVLLSGCVCLGPARPPSAGQASGGLIIQEGKPAAAAAIGRLLC